MGAVYVNEKLRSAINTMATSGASLQQRLSWAAMNTHTLAVASDKFPTPDLRDRWNAWFASVTKAARPARAGAAGPMSEAEAEARAEEIFKIYVEVESFCRQPAPAPAPAPTPGRPKRGKLSAAEAEPIVGMDED